MATNSNTIEDARHSWFGDSICNNVLHVPDDDDLRNQILQSAGFHLDGNLDTAGRFRAVVERQIGRRLAALRDAGQFARLGFVRLGDYAETRLEMNRRTAQELSRVAKALESLPVLRKASDGHQVNASQVRDLVRIATPETEAGWVRLARDHSVRGLRGLIMAYRKALDGNGGEPGPLEEGSRVEVGIDAPPWFRAKWKTSVALCRKVAGDNGLPEGAAAEIMAAEWRSGAPCSREALQPDPVPVPVHGKAGTPRREADDKSSGTPDATDPDAWLWSSDMFVAERVALESEEDPRSWTSRAWFDEDPDNIATMEEKYLKGPELPRWLAACDGVLSPNPFVLDEELVKLDAARRELDGLTGRMLYTMARMDLFRTMGYRGLADYATERLGLGKSTAKRLVRMERGMLERPEMERAYFEGKLGLAKVGQLLRLPCNRHEARWVRRALQVTARRLEHEIDVVLKRADLVESNVLSLEDRKDLYAVLPAGRDLVGSVSALDQAALKAGETAEVSPGKRVRVSFWMEADAGAFFRETLELIRAAQGQGLRDWECVDRLMDGFFDAHGDWKDPNRYALNHKVFERDGWQCAVPGCSSRQRLHAHHIRYRSRGGPDRLENLTTLCSAHHLHATHKGILVVAGRAPDRLTWYLGMQSDGRSLMVVEPGECLKQRA